MAWVPIPFNVLGDRSNQPSGLEINDLLEIRNKHGLIYKRKCYLNSKRIDYDKLNLTTEHWIPIPLNPSYSIFQGHIKHNTEDYDVKVFSEAQINETRYQLDHFHIAEQVLRINRFLQG